MPGPTEVLAEVPAPVAEVPASSDTAIVTPEEQSEQPPAQGEVPKTFTQEELDAAVGKRLSKARRQWEREQVTRQPERSPSTEPLTIDQFSSTEEYADALANQRAHEMVTRREAHREFLAVEESYTEREETAREKYDDYDLIARNPVLPVTDGMAQAIVTSDKGPDILYWLGSNPKEAAKIAQLSPIQQAREIGVIEAKLALEPPARKPSAAPVPINPISANRAPAVSTHDTTDPRSIDTLPVGDWIAAENARVASKYKSR